MVLRSNNELFLDIKEKDVKWQLAIRQPLLRHEAIKLELIEWLTHLDDDDTISYSKIVNDSSETGGDWWQYLSENQKRGIERGLLDIDVGMVTPHDQVKNKYGLQTILVQGIYKQSLSNQSITNSI